MNNFKFKIPILKKKTNKFLKIKIKIFKNIRYILKQILIIKYNNIKLHKMINKYKFNKMIKIYKLIKVKIKININFYKKIKI